MEKRQFLTEIEDLITSLDGATGAAKNIREDLRKTCQLREDCWDSERNWIETTIQSLFALGLVAQLPELLPPDDPLPPYLLVRLQRLINASREMSLLSQNAER